MKLEKLRLLLKTAEKITREQSLEKLLVMLSDLAKEILEVDRCSLFLADPSKKTLWTIFAHGVDRIEVPWDSGIVGAVFLSGRPEIVNDAYSDSRFNKEVDKKTGYRTRNILAVPLFDKKGNILGVFQAINKLDGNFTYDDLEVFTLIGGYAASAIENFNLYSELKSAYRETVFKLSHAIEYKDKETKNHVLRTGIYAREIAKQLGVSEDECEVIFLAVQMHDVGKIGIPDRILLKPGPLTNEEWKIMREHPIIGYEILKGSESKILKVASIVALEHHEKLDGSGYPYGKKEDEISFYGKLAAVVDIFDAVTSKRPYRRREWTEEEVRSFFEAEVREGRLDRDIVKVLLENITNFLRIKRKLPTHWMKGHWPFSFRGWSFRPCLRCSTFQFVSPCRIIISRVMFTPSVVRASSVHGAIPD
jgi:HD-GYP domain-containing protein (c-di-GMP phosphodiesterase class II)